MTITTQMRYRRRMEADGWWGRLRLGERTALSAWIDLDDDDLHLPCLLRLATAAGQRSLFLCSRKALATVD